MQRGVCGWEREVGVGGVEPAGQQAFTSAPILRHFQPDLPLTVEADASDFALGCVLSQPSADDPCIPSASTARSLPQLN